MDIQPFTEDQYRAFLALVDDEIRPPGAATHVWEDFPLILAEENRSQMLGICDRGRVVAGVAFLVRQFQTSCGPVPVAGIGSVVTRPENRGRGCSRALQEAVLQRLDAADVPLAVLWTDRPEVYRGRGFAPAGWEFHLGLDSLSAGDGWPAGFSCRPSTPADVPALEALYRRHPYRTLRPAGDAARLYAMPGTRGLVATGQGNEVVAAVFCGKGSDFPHYVAEWSGPCGLVLPLVDEARQRHGVRHLLVPAGGERLAEQLVQRGATVAARASGLWAVVQPEKLARYLQSAGHGAAADPGDPAAVLGTVGGDGVIVPGALTVAVWGLDSV